MKVVALAGGTGSAKLLRGLERVVDDLTVVANVGDNVWMHGLYVCPDLDIAMYTLAGVVDSIHGWGIRRDTREVLERLGELGEETWFTLGDKDLATHIVRTEMLKAGASLTRVTAELCRKFGVRSRILPATDDPLETHLATGQGEMHLQEFWVKRRGRPTIRRIKYIGAESSAPSAEVSSAVASAEMVVVCPANPVSSIGPMLAIPGFREMLSRTSARVVALSPMKGRAPFSGPAAKMMRAVGSSPDSLGVAKRYSDFLDSIVIDDGDGRLSSAIARLGMECHLADARFAGRSDERRLAREVLGA